jgi:hypothetical protein
VWTLTLNDEEFRYTRLAQTDGSPEAFANVANGLADAINQSDSGFAAKYVSATLELGGTPKAGDRITLSLDGAKLLAPTLPEGEEFSYEVTAGDTLPDIIAALETLIEAGGIYAAVPAGDDSLIITRVDGNPLAINLELAGINLQFDVLVTGIASNGTTEGDVSLIVFTPGGESFTVKLIRADSASEADTFFTGGTLDSGSSATIESSTHWASLVIDVDGTGLALPYADGVAWEAILGTRTAVEVEYRLTGVLEDGVLQPGILQADEVVTLLLERDGWTHGYSHTVAEGETLGSVLAALEASVNADTHAGYSAVYDAGEGDDAEDDTLTVSALHGFDSELVITPLEGETTAAASVETRFDETTTRNVGVFHNYTVGANREVKVPDSLDVTVVDNDAPGVLIIQSQDSTDVIEPTEVIRIGDGFLTQTTEVRVKIGESTETIVTATTWTAVLVRASDTQGAPPVVEQIPVPIAIGTNLDDAVAALAAAIEADSAYNYNTDETSGPYLSVSSDATFSLYVLKGDPATEENVQVVFVGDFGTAITREIGVHDSVFFAQDLDAAKWNTNSSSNIENATTVPHLTVLGSGDGNPDFYSFEITEEMLKQAEADGDPGVDVVFDIDHGYDSGDEQGWGSLLRLWELRDPLDPEQPKLPNELAASNRLNALLDSGSTTLHDGLLSYTIEETGIYYIEVTSAWPAGLDGLPEGVDYELHVSIEYPAEDTFLFAPEPVAEQEVTNNTVQDLDGVPTDSSFGDNFYTLYDPTVGNTDFSPEEPIDSTSPYVRIIGSGDRTASADIYSFNIKPEPSDIEPGAGSDLVPATDDYYIDVELGFNGRTEAGDVGKLGLGYRDYQVVAETSSVA